jgi:ornithine carbamoyltransferase
MGQEGEAAERIKIMQPFQLNADLMALAAPDAVVQHCGCMCKKPSWLS